MGKLIADKFIAWQQECETRFATLKSNEEELNRIFIDIYGLQDELTPEVEDKDVTVTRIFDNKEAIPESMKGSKYALTRTDVVKSLISYAIGCIFGRYSLDVEGLAYAGGDFSEKWVVVSGKYYLRGVVAQYVLEELSRVGCLAESDGCYRDNIYTSEETTERGDILAIGSNATGNGVDTIEHSGGSVPQIDKGVHPIPVCCARVKIGTGDAVIDLCSSEILDAIRNGDGAFFIERDWENAECINWKTIHSSLTTNHLGVVYDAILPICDDEYFEDDIMVRFVDFVRKVYGEETLEENLKYIADAISPSREEPKAAASFSKGTSSRAAGVCSLRAVIRNYFLNDFFKDHCKIYQKRPIYWLFDSGKKNGFKALIYLHRYTRYLLAKLRTDYVHEQQERYRTQLSHVSESMISASGSDNLRLTKQHGKLTEQLHEITAYEEKIHHLADKLIWIELDDGVKRNYELFADVLAKIV